MSTGTLIHAMSLCTGIGGLDLGVSRALGGRYRCVGYVERDAYAAATLVARMESADLDRAPVFDTLESFPCELYRGRVDLVTAGFPCQPASTAGKRQGRSDDRWLWPLIADIIRRVEPSLVFLENVPGLLSVDRGHAFRDVLESLASLGFDAEWSSLRASDVGAPHQRERVFVLAWHVSDAGRDALRLVAEWCSERARPAEQRDAELGDVGAGLADATSGRAWRAGLGREAPDDPVELGDASVARLERDPAARGGRAFTPGTDGDLEHADRALLNRERTTRWHDAHGCSGGTAWPPGPGDTEGWRRWIAEGGPEPSICRSTSRLPHRMDGDLEAVLSNRLDRLRCLGNAVVPAQAEAAFSGLIARAMQLEM